MFNHSVMNFKDLLGRGSADDQMNAQIQFPHQLRVHGMRLWQPGDLYAGVGERFLLGVAARYSLYDLELLDELSHKIKRGCLASDHLDIFDLSTIADMEDFEDYIPGITPVSQTPVLGVWKHGVLSERLQGFFARRRLLSIP